MMAVRGGLAMAFGATLALWPDVTLPTVVVLFAVYAILDGAWAIGAATWTSERGFALDAWPVALEGLFGVAVGVIALAWPFVPRDLVYVVALWGAVTGALELLITPFVPRDRAAHWLLATAGVCSLFLAVLIVVLPLVGGALVVRLVASYAIIFGVLLMSAAVGFRDAARSARPATGGRIPAA
jgi:uncharacterized membrane protein HdeD (DUF308 family)